MPDFDDDLDDDLDDFGLPKDGLLPSEVYRQAEDMARRYGYDELSEGWGAAVAWYAGQIYEPPPETED